MSKSVFHLADGAPVVAQEEQKRKELEGDEAVVKEFVASVRQDLQTNNVYLPTLPALALEALLVINNIDSSASDLQKVISRDAALTARLIRYANSPLYRGMNTITSIKPAITRIGFQRVKNAVYAVSMKEVFRTSVKPIEQRMDALWAHSVKVGAQAAILAKTQPGMDADVALVAGLVHDIGHIPLLIKACDYEVLVNKPEVLDKLLYKLHTQLGGSILKLWKFDEQVIKAAAEHENLARDPGDAPVDYVDIVQVANILTHEGTEHRLANIDRSKIKAFARVKQGEPTSQPDDDDDTRAVEDVLF
jgi:putative nucleotidyltransferase with HDIG domain